MALQMDGNWSKWAPYGQCSRTCGGGVQLAKRECSNPPPANEGKYCEGVRVKYRSCGLDPCSNSGEALHSVKCQTGRVHVWIRPLGSLTLNRILFSQSQARASAKSSARRSTATTTAQTVSRPPSPGSRSIPESPPGTSASSSAERTGRGTFTSWLRR